MMREMFVDDLFWMRFLDPFLGPAAPDSTCLGRDHWSILANTRSSMWWLISVNASGDTRNCGGPHRRPTSRGHRRPAFGNVIDRFCIEVVRWPKAAGSGNQLVQATQLTQPLSA